jgi:hypothetical protein
MAASSTLPQQNVSRKSQIGNTGVLTLSGFGIKVRMQRGHLEIEDGVGLERRTIRLPRIGHDLKRLVCISEDGFITLSALKWLADVGASFLMLNRNGKVLLVTGPPVLTMHAYAARNIVPLAVTQGSRSHER